MRRRRWVENGRGAPGVYEEKEVGGKRKGGHQGCMRRRRWVENDFKLKL